MRLSTSLICSFLFSACATTPGIESLRGGPADPGAAEASTPVFLALADHADAGHDHVSESSSADALYVCPMHPEVTSHEPGRCPKCGMKLVAQKPKP